MFFSISYNADGYTPVWDLELINCQNTKKMNKEIKQQEPTNPKLRVAEVSIRDYSMLMHMSLSTKHLLKEQGTFVCPDLPLHDKKFFKETVTPVKNYFEFGKPKVLFYLDEPESPAFPTIKLLVAHYHGC